MIKNLRYLPLIWPDRAFGARIFCLNLPYTQKGKCMQPKYQFHGVFFSSNKNCHHFSESNFNRIPKNSKQMPCSVWLLWPYFFRFHKKKKQNFQKLLSSKESWQQNPEEKSSAFPYLFFLTKEPFLLDSALSSPSPSCVFTLCSILLLSAHFTFIRKWGLAPKVYGLELLEKMAATGAAPAVASILLFPKHSPNFFTFTSRHFMFTVRQKTSNSFGLGKKRTAQVGWP